MSEPIRVLLVEDNPGDARLIREALRECAPMGCELLHADRMATARELLASTPVDVVLLDLSLPDAHGMQTVTRTLEAAPDLPIVVLTGLDDESVALQAVQAGAQDYLVKGTLEGALLMRSMRYARERKRLERERQGLLQREREARAEAEAAVRGRDEVLRVVSHDLGNSLSAVGIHARLLERLAASGAEVEAEAVRHRARAIRELVEQMHRLRQDLLDAASLEAGRLSMHFAALDAGGVIGEVATALSALAADKGQQMELDVAEGLPTLKADRQRLAQVLQNLLGNAIKFTPAGGQVGVRAAASGPLVQVEVWDTGPGIAAEHHELVFDRFWKGATGDRPGSGLGLAIARGIVEAHGGRIWVESESGRGSRFRLELPASPA